MNAVLLLKALRTLLPSTRIALMLDEEADHLVVQIFDEATFDRYILDSEDDLIKDPALVAEEILMLRMRKARGGQKATEPVAGPLDPRS